jgi:hypothetical protein
LNGAAAPRVCAAGGGPGAWPHGGDRQLRAGGSGAARGQWDAVRAEVPGPAAGGGQWAAACGGARARRPRAARPRARAAPTRRPPARRRGRSRAGRAGRRASVRPETPGRAGRAGAPVSSTVRARAPMSSGMVSGMCDDTHRHGGLLACPIVYSYRHRPPRERPPTKAGTRNEKVHRMRPPDRPVGRVPQGSMR